MWDVRVVELGSRESRTCNVSGTDQLVPIESMHRSDVCSRGNVEID